MNSGRITLRVKPELHTRLAALAEALGTDLNGLLNLMIVRSLPTLTAELEPFVKVMEGPPPAQPQQPPTLSPEEWLRDRLLEGHETAASVIRAANQEGVCGESRLRRAKQVLGVIAYRMGTKTVWRLPSQEERDA